jgi:hypothetical protein
MTDSDRDVTESSTHCPVPTAGGDCPQCPVPTAQCPQCPLPSAHCPVPTVPSAHCPLPLPLIMLSRGCGLQCLHGPAAAGCTAAAVPLPCQAALPLQLRCCTAAALLQCCCTQCTGSALSAAPRLTQPQTLLRVSAAQRPQPAGSAASSAGHGSRVA